jgi:hypothetical protein
MQCPLHPYSGYHDWRLSIAFPWFIFRCGHRAHWRNPNDRLSAMPDMVLAKIYTFSLIISRK